MRNKKFAASVAALAMISSFASVIPMNASAAGGGDYGVKIGGTRTTTFDKYMVMNTSAHVPDAEFNFTIEPGSAVNATTTSKVFAGVGTPTFAVDDATHTGSNTAGKVVFSNSDTTYLESSLTETSSDKPVFTTTGEGNTSDEKYAKKTLTITFPDSTPFKEPGIYRYIITEAGTAAGVTNDEVSTRTLDVYVVDDYDAANDKNLLKIDGYALYSGTVTAGPAKELPAGKEVTDVPNGLEAGTKSAGYTNTYTARTLSFGKEVEGNQGSKDKYFKFTLAIGNAAGATLNVKVANMDTATTKTDSTIYTKAVMDEANNADDVDSIDGHQIKVGTTGAVSKDFYLRDGQYVTIEGLPQGATYVLTEEAEDYTSTSGTNKEAIAAVGTSGETGYVAAKLYSDATSGTIGANDIYTGFTNTRTGMIPTGLLSTVAGSAGLIALGLAGIVGGTFYLKKKKSEEE